MRLGVAVLLTTIAASAGPGSSPAAQERADQPLFRTSVEMVSMAAVVRDGRGRVVPSLSREDFVVLDAGSRRIIVDLRADMSAPLSVALLVDSSGSMRVGYTLDAARSVARDFLNVLDPRRDEAALFTFDRRLLELVDFTRDFDPIRMRLEDLDAYGTTSLYDAIADTSKRVSRFASRRRAIVVLTDGTDTSSRFAPSDVSAMASAVDVPVYVLALNAAGGHGQGPLADLARWSGGAYLAAGHRQLALSAVRQITEELRHQYVLAFEPASSDGWHRVEIKMRKPGLTVRSRSWYLAGPGE